MRRPQTSNAPQTRIPQALGVTLGSAIFNQLAIVGACALVALGGGLQVAWRAILRDILAWSVTIVVMAVLFADHVVTALDAWLLVGTSPGRS